MLGTVSRVLCRGINVIPAASRRTALNDIWVPCKWLTYCAFDYEQADSLDLDALQVVHAVGIAICFVTPVARKPLNLILENIGYG